MQHLWGQRAAQGGAHEGVGEDAPAFLGVQGRDRGQQHAAFGRAGGESALDVLPYVVPRLSTVPEGPSPCENGVEPLLVQGSLAPAHRRSRACGPPGTLTPCVIAVNARFRPDPGPGPGRHPTAKCNSGRAQVT
ncbi:hypothetical protein GCM10010315_11170 [Streptomyces luteosporeus]|uniref:Uncharacterized protein n=1 Tax=Streptomyces luteosporeus TaxID=173856 RepID=A0ABP6G1S9_9ACTN